MMKILSIILLNVLFYNRMFLYQWVSDDKPAHENKDSMLLERGLSVILHTLNCLLIFFVFGGNDVSYMASLLFALNPVNMQAGLWISGRNYSVAAALALTPMLFNFNLWVLSLPIVLFVINGFKIKNGSIKSKYSDLKGTNKETNIVAPRKLILFVKTLKYYLLLCLLNPKLGFFHAPLKVIGVTKKYDKENYSLNLDFWVGILLTYIIATNLFFNYSFAWFGIIFFLYNFLIWGNIITIQMIIAERYIYLANVGLMFFVASIIPQPYILLVLGWYACRNWYYQPSFMNEYWLNSYNTTEQKDNWYAWNLAGQKEAISDNITGALKCFMEAYKYNPSEYRVLMNIAHCYLLFGDVEKVEFYVKEAEVYIYDDEDCKKYLDQFNGFLDKLKTDGKIILSELNGKVGFFQ